MPYYCTVPRCTSMAGKAKNVSFHQFPRDEELARLWNDILKRGKPYTKYSKVCSLHFKPEDYTITSVGRNKGQWRTLRKDAIPSMNLPLETPPPSQGRSSTGVPGGIPPNLMDPQVQQQVAQAIYMQTMLAMQAASYRGEGVDLSVRQDALPNQDDASDHSDEADHQQPESSHRDMSELEKFLLKYNNLNEITRPPEPKQGNDPTSYKCQECTKCFKDPDVFLLHKRTHIPQDGAVKDEAQNRTISPLDGVVSEENSNVKVKNDSTLRANPILANLLKPEETKVPASVNLGKEIMQAMALNMEAYFRSIVATKKGYIEDSGSESERCEELNGSSESNRLIIDETV
ncbi:unnamed protein product [Plutella xylostella]|uniref:(diamondback moth) hypothetical protein n=1 Tax=Plutella xylostella TaxID=51655 RepID=A0A8S4FU80_PLUXY|nr:unnamed protein product [Plutella xylostella]